MMRRRSSSGRLPHAAISAPVRRQPSHRPSLPRVQTPMHGLETRRCGMGRNWKESGSLGTGVSLFSCGTAGGRASIFRMNETLESLSFA